MGMDAPGMTERETIDASEALDYQGEEDAGHADGLIAEGEAEVFCPDTADKVNWVLDKIATHRARAARIRENAELMAKEAEREAAGLEWKYGPALQAFLRAQTDGTKRRSVRLEHGVLGFKTRPAALLLDQSEGFALSFAQEHAPETVTARVDARAFTKRFQFTEDFDGTQRLVDTETGQCYTRPAWLTQTPAEEVFYIK